nr:hypothetical protein [uncultured Porphyromonas sp.]
MRQGQGQGGRGEEQDEAKLAYSKDAPAKIRRASDSGRPSHASRQGSKKAAAAVPVSTGQLRPLR